MKRFYQTLIALLMLASPVLAQDDGRAPEGTPAVTSFTLEQAIQYALENSVNMKNAAIDEQIASARVKETRGIGLPQVTGDVSLVHNEQLPRMFMMKQTMYNFAGRDANGDPIPYDEFLPGVRDQDVLAGQNFFQLKNSGNAGLSLNQILFNGSYLVGLQAASAYRDLATKATAQTKEQVIQQVTKAYYSVLINKDRMNLFDNNITRVESLLRTTKALYENGFAESIDVDRIQVALNNLTTEREKFYNLQELTTQLLKFQMNFPMEKEITIAGDISSLVIDENLLNNYALEWDYSKRSDYQLLKANQKLQQLNVKNNFAGSLPSLVAFANYGFATGSGTFGGLFKTETNWTEVAGLGPDKWYPVSSFGLALSVPIFSGLQRTYKLQQAKLDLLKVENNFTSLKQGIDLQIKQSAISYLNAVKSLKSQEENRKLAENIARITKIKYEEGVGSNTEVIDAETSLKEAQINYYSALFDALVAKVDLDAAYGKLSEPTITENK